MKQETFEKILKAKIPFVAPTAGLGDKIYYKGMKNVEDYVKSELPKVSFTYY